MNAIVDIEVLLVEDNPTDAELTILALKERNLANHLVWVKDGAEALDFLFAEGAYTDRKNKAEPKLVLLDLRLPKVDGLEVLQKMRANPLTQIVPVVVMTSSALDKDIETSYNLGANSYIQKPINFDEFTKVVSDLGFYWLAINKTDGTK
jgi:CheY-like chemotaxis protein